MKTYQDLLNVGEDVIAKGEFCVDAVDDFRASEDYRKGADGEAYYAKRNITIENYKKCLYTMSGRKIEDVYSSNYKLKSGHFRRLTTQQVQYVLGNGVTLEKQNNKEKLGKDFDFQLQNVAKRAIASGRGYGFWNYDHMEVFGYVDTPKIPGFCPLKDNYTSDLRAGIRFWSEYIGEDMHYWYTLYEEDGYTGYRRIGDGNVEVAEEKKPYKITTVRSKAGGVENVIGENYHRLPIVELFANDLKESELTLIREDVDAHDFIKSGFANVIDETSEVYWLIKNAGGMDDPDIAHMLERIKTLHAAIGDDETEAMPQTINIPVEARDRMLEILRNDIYEDFGALDVRTLSAAQKTTQEIQAAYQGQDNKCADFEYFVIDFVQQILELAGIDDNPTFKWNKVVNMNEQTQMVLSAANLLPNEMLIKLLPFLTPEQAAEAIDSIDKDEYNRFNQPLQDDEEEDEEE